MVTHGLAAKSSGWKLCSKVHLQIIGHEAGIDGGTRGADRAAQHRRYRVQQAKVVGALQPAPACHRAAPQPLAERRAAAIAQAQPIVQPQPTQQVLNQVHHRHKQLLSNLSMGA